MPRIARRLRGEVRLLLALRRLPHRVAIFQWRAARLARRIGDDFSLASATRPDKLELILALSRGHHAVAELGTATGWGSVSLLLAEPQRTVITFDPFEHATRALYLDLVSARVRARLTQLMGPGAEVPSWIDSVDFLYIDSTHGREATITEFHAWRDHLRPDALVVFDDYDHPDFPGVREAVRELALTGEEQRGLFIHRVAR